MSTHSPIRDKFLERCSLSKDQSIRSFEHIVSFMSCIVVLPCSVRVQNMIIEGQDAVVARFTVTLTLGFPGFLRRNEGEKTLDLQASSGDLAMTDQSLLGMSVKRCAVPTEGCT